MENRKKNISIFIVIVVALAFYVTHSLLYYETIYNSDGAYVLLQMRDFLLGNRFDLLHVGYEYCGIIEHFPSAILSFLLPISWSTVLGMFFYYVVGFFLICHVFKNERSKIFALVLLMLFPTPTIFFQSYAALGGHTYTLFQYFVLIFFLTHKRFKIKENENYKYKYSTYIWVGLSGGLAYSSYQLAQLLIVVSIITLIINDLHADIQNISNKVKDIFSKIIIPLVAKVLLFFISIQLGNLPATLSLRFFPKDHFPGAFSPYFSWHHMMEKIKPFKEVLSSLFAPVWSHDLILTSGFNHFNVPVFETFQHRSRIGLAIFFFLVAMIIIYAIINLIKKQTTQTMFKQILSLPQNNFAILSMLTIFAFIGGYLVRAEFVDIDFESRYMLTLYFSFLIFFLYMVHERVSVPIIILFSVVSIFGHSIILYKNYRFLVDSASASTSASAKELSCQSLTRTHFFSLIERVEAKANVKIAVAGSYWEVWPLSTILKTNLVWDVTKNKFFYNNDKFFKHHPVIYLASTNSVSNQTEQDLPKELLGHNYDFYRSQIGPYLVYIDNINNLNLMEIINDEMKILGKGPCKFTRVK
ncbi:MAG: hypothetical protein HQK49_11595 [Oligoflexia bacterium]|nr:hypothetical protein [Oligoflexia bacterium]